MPRYSDRSIFEKLGLQFSKLECELRDLIFDYEEEVEIYQLQMAKIRRIQLELARERQQVNVQGASDQKRRDKISFLLKKLTLLKVPDQPDTKAYLREKEALESRIALLMKQNAQLLAMQCTQRVN